MNAASSTDTTHFALWVYLSHTPLLWLCVTIVMFCIADSLSLATKRHPLANPVMIAIILVGSLLLLTHTSYQDYFEGAQFIHFLLGPAIVALAIPLYDYRREVVKTLIPMLGALVTGSVVAVTSALLIAKIFGVPTPILIAMAPKSVTAGVAMGITQMLGGDPTLSAVFVIVTGMIGGIIVTPLFNLCGFSDWRARGFAAGLAAHGIGTARAFQMNSLAGVFAGIAMGLNAFLTAILVPLIIALVLH